MVKAQHNSLSTLTKEWFSDSLWKLKQGSLKKRKLNFSVIVVIKRKKSSFVFIIFHRD